MNTLGETDFLVRGYECGPNALATMASVMNYLQEAAGLQAEKSGFSKLDFNAAGEDISWVLTRFHLKMNRYPRWHETVRVATWPCGGRKIVANRDFEVFLGDEKIGAATSEWMLLNLTTRKIVPVPQNVYDLANDERPRALGADHQFAKLRWDAAAHADALERDPPVDAKSVRVASPVDAKSVRVASPVDAKSVRVASPVNPTPFASTVRLRARRNDVDINGHVNNVRYIEWLMETLPVTPTPCLPVRDFEIAFKSETMAGDEVVAESLEIEPGVYMSHAAAPDGHDHVVARFSCLYKHEKESSVENRSALEK